MKISKAQKNEISQCLEAGKPLPEEYRFLLFEDKLELDLAWKGRTNQTSDIVLPFQVIEQVDEPRKGKGTSLSGSSDEDSDEQGEIFDSRGRQLKGWSNKLIWGENSLILSTLKNGPLRKIIEEQGGGGKPYLHRPTLCGWC